MPIAPPPVPSLSPSAIYSSPEAVDSGLLKVMPGGGADQFLSLLNISSGLADAQQFAARDGSEAPPAFKPSKEKNAPSEPEASRRESRF